MVSDSKLASAMGGKTARACDNCIRKRARWYCPADDAFLCQNCDSSVHSANPLARRHERVRLKTSSLKESSPDENFPNLESPVSVSLPSWHSGFTRKARTPRNGRKASKSIEDEEEEEVILKNPIHLVPEILSDENSLDENEEQLLYRVPIFDPFVAEFCMSATRNDKMENVQTTIEADSGFKLESKETLQHDNISNGDLNRFHGMLPSEMELAEFAADVESLLGKGLEDESFDMEGLGLLEGCNKEGNSMECSMVSTHEKVKIEEEGEGDEVVMDTTTTNHDIDINGDTFEFKFDYDSPININGEDEIGEVVMKINGEDGVVGNGNYNEKKKILLNLDYEGVLTAWADQRSPWTNGERPELDSNDCWPDCMGNCGTIHPYGIMNGHATIIDRGREARVSRYREKRRTRLFSKKIRYEVRKLNAEKRPRMKGRFVKRSNLVPNYPLVK
ncbi:PREDICTED: zinc finger protein CONSTANS-LIKE 16-like [Nicotiana attenuata]|uniref:Zinc finger protein constans-like 16 n=1 Tax=Nicotiana attenuata TaxID=49451 RepID=A0A1J6JVW4_NICAT|nr:PREDICTED: zinc finger protein CONSTANS-LIKE 16-like [Nicotiana attenuata]OIT21885.1 zinc finger protein constans-like 16 [Nicotiana attenuata]